MESWNSALQAGYLTDPSLETEGFIHCSFESQVLVPANERYAGRDDLHLLVIDPERVEAQIVIEDSYGSGTAFPHIYGELNVTAVLAVLPFPRGASGQFEVVPSTETS